MPGKATAPARINLVRFGVQDFDRLMSWLPAEADLVDWCAAFFRYPLTHAQLERYLQSSERPNVREIFTARSDDAEAVGHIEISQIWPHLSSRLSRILVAPGKRHRGIALSMVAQAVSRTFDVHGVDRVDLGVSSNNIAAIGCYKKVGFAQVGLWPSAIIAGSHNIDVVWMTMTRDRWNESCDGNKDRLKPKTANDR
jgi:RimJ/RimL family protein N-acetyltransferase